MDNWWIYKGTGTPHDGIERLPPPPPWRTFNGNVIERLLTTQERSVAFLIDQETAALVNAALYLRRPLLVTGKPGTGKSSLARAVAHELKLGPILQWSITTKSTLTDALYRYDAIARLHDASIKRQEGPSIDKLDIGRYLKLGPLGTALLPTRLPRVLLIDEIDKSDIDLPNDLLHVFEKGEFEIPELSRLSWNMKTVSIMPEDAVDDNDRVLIENGRIRCHAFPFVVLTSNGEREFPPAFLRRCLRLDMTYPTKEKLVQIVTSHLGTKTTKQVQYLVEQFLERRTKGDLATDQLLNAIYLCMNGVGVNEKTEILNAVLRYLTPIETL